MNYNLVLFIFLFIVSIGLLIGYFKWKGSYDFTGVEQDLCILYKDVKNKQCGFWDTLTEKCFKGDCGDTKCTAPNCKKPQYIGPYILLGAAALVFLYSVPYAIKAYFYWKNK